MTNGFDLGSDLELWLWIFKVKCDLYLWPYAWCWPTIFMVKFWNSYISEWEGQLTLNKGDGSRSFMTMTVAIWWPRSGERIYHIVTGLTSDVGEPSTRLVQLQDQTIFNMISQIWWENGQHRLSAELESRSIDIYLYFCQYHDNCYLEKVCIMYVPLFW